jgi:TatD DNase family protein
MAVFFDTHAHLDFPDFEPDLPEVVARAEAGGISRIITIGTTMESSRRAVALAQRFPNIFAAVGWHPGHAEEAPEDFRVELRDLARSPKVVAIGECGLDYYRLPGKIGESAEADERIKARQLQVFRQQIEVAADLGLNVVVHTRESFADTVDVLSSSACSVRGVFHCFVGTPDEMRQVLGLGSLVSFTGIATFRNAAGVRESLAACPAGHFMLETDCPFLAPVPFRGTRCEPGYVHNLAQGVAELRGESLEALGQQTCEAARAFFRGLA